MTRPASIVWFERLYLGSLVMGLVDDFVYWDGSLAIVYARRFLPLQCFKFGLLVLFGLLVSRRRSRISKWVILVLFAAGLPFFIAGLSFDAFSESAFAAIGETLFGAIALGLLFTPSARAWLANPAGKQPSLPPLHETFE